MTQRKVPIVNKEKTKNIFTALMLQYRWDKDIEEVLEIIEDNHIRAFCLGEDLQPGQTVQVEHIILWEEDILKLEKKNKIAHNKLKPRKLILPVEH